MEQSLKARLIGATVLVALAVILVPELLTGRKATGEAPATSDSQGSRTFTIELGGTDSRPAAQAPAAAAPTASAGNARAASTTAAGDAAAKAPSPAPVPETPRAVAPPPPAAASESQQAAGSASGPTSPPAAAGASGATTVMPVPVQPVRPARDGWLVQVGAFGSADAARSLVKDLEAAGLAAHVSPVTRGGRTLHRVRVGPVAERSEAQRLVARLEARGLPATLVAGE